MPDRIRNTARTYLCRSEECAPDDDQKAAVSMYLGKMGKSELPGYNHLIDLVGRMKESNVWKGTIKGYFFKGSVPTKMKSDIQAYARTAGWKTKTTKRMTKSGILWRSKGKKYLLIFAVYRGIGSKIYCSLTVI